MKLQKGDVNTAVEKLQKLLTNKGFDPKGTDGWFGNDTENAVKAFQTANGLKPSGIVDDKTWATLGGEFSQASDEASHSWKSAPADRYKDGYSSFNLREDAVNAYQKVYDVVHNAGGIIPSSGGKRELSASIGAGRSKTSFHYTGRALDIMIGSAMSNPEKDPLVAIQDSSDKNPYWRVFAKAPQGTQMTLECVIWEKNNISSKSVSATFIDLTELFVQAGFDRIRARNNWQTTYINCEWWHFQYIKGLVAGESTFGYELLKVYDRREVERFPPWDYRNYVFDGKGFSQP